MIRAALIEPFTPVVEIVEVDKDDWAAVQRLVSGGTMTVDLESVTLPGAILLVDEHGKLKGDPFNQIATSLVRPRLGDDFIVGRALLFGPPVDEELSSVTSDWIERILALGATIKEST